MGKSLGATWPPEADRFTYSISWGKLLLMSVFYDPKQFCASFSPESPDFWGYSSDFEESVVSKDFWKLVIDEHGNYGFREDGSLDFDLSALSEDERASISELLKFEGTGLTNDGRVRAEDMSEALLSLMGGNAQNSKTFVGGAAALAGASVEAKSLISILSLSDSWSYKNSLDENALSSQFSNMNELLLLAQESGIIVKNEYQTYEGDGTIFASEPGVDPTWTSGSGNRLVTLLSNHREPYSLQLHLPWDFTVPDGSRGLLSPEAGSLSLNFSKTGGLASIFTSQSGVDQLTMMHTSPETIMSYLQTFGMQGTALQEKAGNFSISGIQDNTVIGIVGNTGTDTSRDHLHLVYKQLKRGDWVQADPGLYGPYKGLSSSFATTPYTDMVSAWGSSTWTIPMINSVDNYSRTRIAAGSFNGQGFSMEDFLIANMARQQDFSFSNLIINNWEDLNPWYKNIIESIQYGKNQNEEAKVTSLLFYILNYIGM